MAPDRTINSLFFPRPFPISRPSSEHSNRQHSQSQTSTTPLFQSVESTPISTSSSNMNSTSILEAKKKKTTRSDIWDHGALISPKSHIWKCKHCSDIFEIRNEDGFALKHIGIHEYGPHAAKAEAKLPKNQKRIDESIKPTIESKVLRKLLVEWMIDRRHSFNKVESEFFQRIIRYINEAIISKLPKSDKTVRADCMKYFQQVKLSITELLSIARSNIHLSFDLSTSSNCKALLAITGHWTSHNYQLVSTLLAIRELEEKHTGQNISAIIYEVAKKFGIADKLGYFMMNNASNNDTALKHLDARLRADGIPGFDPVERRLRCFGHVVALAVKDLLFISKRKNEEEEEEKEQTVDKAEAENQRWRAMGAMGKAHNIVKYIRLNPQHRMEYLNQQVEEIRKDMLRQNNFTR
jgi:hypothetical protein